MKSIIVFSCAAFLALLVACGPGNLSTDAQQAASAIAGSDATVVAEVNALASAVAEPSMQATAAAVMNEAATALSDPGVQATIDSAFKSLNDQVTLTQGQPLTLDALSNIPNVTGWKMTIVDAPAAAAASKGQVIKEASGANISINPDDYNKYFTTAGDYKVRLDLTTNGTETTSHEFTVTVP